MRHAAGLADAKAEEADRLDHAIRVAVHLSTKGLRIFGTLK
jgi:hypothetical protein